jgi:hypothetical protein
MQTELDADYDLKRDRECLVDDSSPGQIIKRPRILNESFDEAGCMDTGMDTGADCEQACLNDKGPTSSRRRDELTVFVKGLPKDLCKEELETLFKACGSLREIRMVNHPDGKFRVSHLRYLCQWTEASCYKPDTCSAEPYCKYRDLLTWSSCPKKLKSKLWP